MAITFAQPDEKQPDKRGRGRPVAGNQEQKLAVWVSLELANAVRACSRDSGQPITVIARKALQEYVDAAKK